MTATDRFKMMLATALEKVCILEEALEAAQERISELEAQQNGKVTEHDRA